MTDAKPSIEEGDIRSLANPQSFERGRNYYRSGAIFNTRLVGNELSGYCRGSSYSPYRVSAQLGLGRISTTHCSCPYDWGGVCKHIVALLLTWVHTPEVFQLAVPVNERLASRSKEDLIALILEMLKREPDLERILDLNLQPDPESPLDLDAFRRQINFVLQDGIPNHHKLAIELAAITETADCFATEENWAAAGSIYHLILTDIISVYDELYDEDGDISGEIYRCVMGLEGCLMNGTLDNDTRQSWFNALLDDSR